ncbi:Dynein heavy chain, partial [Aduncisulcus paluster]
LALQHLLETQACVCVSHEGYVLEHSERILPIIEKDVDNIFGRSVKYVMLDENKEETGLVDVAGFYITNFGRAVLAFPGNLSGAHLSYMCACLGSPTLGCVIGACDDTTWLVNTHDYYEIPEKGFSLANSLFKSYSSEKFEALTSYNAARYVESSIHASYGRSILSKGMLSDIFVGLSVVQLAQTNRLTYATCDALSLSFINCTTFVERVCRVANSMCQMLPSMTVALYPLLALNRRLRARAEGVNSHRYQRGRGRGRSSSRYHSRVYHPQSRGRKRHADLEPQSIQNEIAATPKNVYLGHGVNISLISNHTPPSVPPRVKKEEEDIDEQKDDIGWGDVEVKEEEHKKREEEEDEEEEEQSISDEREVEVPDSVSSSSQIILPLPSPEELLAILWVTMGYSRTLFTVRFSNSTVNTSCSPTSSINEYISEYWKSTFSFAPEYVPLAIPFTMPHRMASFPKIGRQNHRPIVNLFSRINQCLALGVDPKEGSINIKIEPACQVSMNKRLVYFSKNNSQILTDKQKAYDRAHPPPSSWDPTPVPTPLDEFGYIWYTSPDLSAVLTTRVKRPEKIFSSMFPGMCMMPPGISGFVNALHSIQGRAGDMDGLKLGSSEDIGIPPKVRKMYQDLLDSSSTDIDGDELKRKQKIITAQYLLSKPVLSMRTDSYKLHAIREAKGDSVTISNSVLQHSFNTNSIRKEEWNSVMNGDEFHVAICASLCCDDYFPQWFTMLPTHAPTLASILTMSRGTNMMDGLWVCELPEELKQKCLEVRADTMTVFSTMFDPDVEFNSKNVVEMRHRIAHIIEEASAETIEMTEEEILERRKTERTQFIESASRKTRFGNIDELDRIHEAKMEKLREEEKKKEEWKSDNYYVTSEETRQSHDLEQKEAHLKHITSVQLDKAIATARRLVNAGKSCPGPPRLPAGVTNEQLHRWGLYEKYEFLQYPKKVPAMLLSGKILPWEKEIKVKQMTSWDEGAPVTVHTYSAKDDWKPLRNDKPEPSKAQPTTRPQPPRQEKSSFVPPPPVYSPPRPERPSSASKFSDTAPGSYQSTVPRDALPWTPSTTPRSSAQGWSPVTTSVSPPTLGSRTPSSVMSADQFAAQAFTKKSSRKNKVSKYALDRVRVDDIFSSGPGSSRPSAIASPSSTPSSVMSADQFAAQAFTKKSSLAKKVNKGRLMSTNMSDIFGGKSTNAPAHRSVSAGIHRPIPSRPTPSFMGRSRASPPRPSKSIKGRGRGGGRGRGRGRGRGVSISDVFSGSFKPNPPPLVRRDPYDRRPAPPSRPPASSGSSSVSSSSRWAEPVSPATSSVRYVSPAPKVVPFQSLREEEARRSYKPPASVTSSASSSTTSSVMSADAFAAQAFDKKSSKKKQVSKIALATTFTDDIFGGSPSKKPTPSRIRHSPHPSSGPTPVPGSLNLDDFRRKRAALSKLKSAQHALKAGIGVLPPAKPKEEMGKKTTPQYLKINAPNLIPDAPLLPLDFYKSEDSSKEEALKLREKMEADIRHTIFLNEIIWKMTVTDQPKPDLSQLRYQMILKQQQQRKRSYFTSDKLWELQVRVGDIFKVGGEAAKRLFPPSPDTIDNILTQVSKDVNAGTVFLLEPLLDEVRTLHTRCVVESAMNTRRIEDPEYEASLAYLRLPSPPSLTLKPTILGVALPWPLPSQPTGEDLIAQETALAKKIADAEEKARAEGRELSVEKRDDLMRPPEVKLILEHSIHMDSIRKALFSRFFPATRAGKTILGVVMKEIQQGISQKGLLYVDISTFSPTHAPHQYIYFMQNRVRILSGIKQGVRKEKEKHEKEEQERLKREALAEAGSNPAISKIPPLTALKANEEAMIDERLLEVEEDVEVAEGPTITGNVVIIPAVGRMALPVDPQEFVKAQHRHYLGSRFLLAEKWHDKLISTVQFSFEECGVNLYHPGATVHWEGSGEDMENDVETSDLKEIETAASSSAFSPGNSSMMDRYDPMNNRKVGRLVFDDAKGAFGASFPSTDGSSTSNSNRKVKHPPSTCVSCHVNGFRDGIMYQPFTLDRIVELCVLCDRMISRAIHTTIRESVEQLLAFLESYNVYDPGDGVKIVKDWICGTFEGNVVSARLLEVAGNAADSSESLSARGRSSPSGRSSRTGGRTSRTGRGKFATAENVLVRHVAEEEKMDNITLVPFSVLPAIIGVTDNDGYVTSGEYFAFHPITFPDSAVPHRQVDASGAGSASSTPSTPLFIIKVSCIDEETLWKECGKAGMKHKKELFGMKKKEKEVKKERKRRGSRLRMDAIRLDGLEDGSLKRNNKRAADQEEEEEPQHEWNSEPFPQPELQMSPSHDFISRNLHTHISDLEVLPSSIIQLSLRVLSLAHSFKDIAASLPQSSLYLPPLNHVTSPWLSDAHKRLEFALGKGFAHATAVLLAYNNVIDSLSLNESCRTLACSVTGRNIDVSVGGIGCGSIDIEEEVESESTRIRCDLARTFEQLWCLGKDMSEDEVIKKRKKKEEKAHSSSDSDYDEEEEEEEEEEDKYSKQRKQKTNENAEELLSPLEILENTRLPDIYAVRLELFRLRRLLSIVPRIIADSKSLGMIYLDLENVESMMASVIEFRIHLLCESIESRANARLDHLLTEWKEIEGKIAVNPQSPEEHAVLKKYVDSIPDLSKSLLHRERAVSQYFEALEEAHKMANGDTHSKYLKVMIMPKKILESLSNLTVRLSDRRLEFENELDIAQENFLEELDVVSEDINQLLQCGDYSQVQQVYPAVQAITESLDNLKQQSKLFNSREALFSRPQSQWPALDGLFKRFEPFKTLWTIAAEYAKQCPTWIDGSFSEIDAQYVQTNVTDWIRSLFKLSKTLGRERSMYSKSLDVIEDLRGQLEDFKMNLPLISALRNPGLRTRHWDKISDVIGSDLRPSPDLTLRQLLELGLTEENKLSEINAVSVQSTKEHTLEKSLDKMSVEWRPVEFDVVPYRESGTYILRATDDVLQLLDDHLVVVQDIRGSPYVKPFESRVRDFETRLLKLQDILDVWLMCQQQWMYLEPIFASDDIRKQMPSESHTFSDVDHSWRIIMSDIHKSPNVMSVASRDEFLGKLQNMNEKLESVQKCLNDYLESKCMAFPRFFFLSADDLLQILSQTRDPRAVNPHLPKSFEGINKLTFDGDIKSVHDVDKLRISQMISKEGEVVEFLEPIVPKGDSEQWLSMVEKGMKAAVKDLIITSLKELAPVLATSPNGDPYNGAPVTVDNAVGRERWVLKWHGQVVLAVNQIIWTQEVESALAEGVRGLKQCRATMTSRLNRLVELVRGRLTSLNRRTLSAILTLDVHNRDVVTTLIDKQVRGRDNFVWTSQLRYYWHEGDVRVRQVQADLLYQYEYLGNSARLVITPLTDRCYMTLTGALSLHLGGAPAGPAGTGKTETVKDLAKGLAIYCMVFNCSDGLDYKAMAKFFKGLAMSGSWSCFDEFNRLHIEVLSVVAQQILTIQRALAENAERFIFEGSDISLNSMFATFITMNPGYAGRTELPDNLSALFRPCAMVVPDYAMIAEIMLFGNGFSEARDLARKITTTLKLSSEQLSSQDHYDYGMRAVKSILVAAGALKRAEPNTPEDQLVLRALLDVNLPKFLSQDVPLFDNIISDLFPRTERQKIDYGLFLSAVEEYCLTKNIQTTPEFLVKVQQLLETLRVRHGLMLVGRTMSGKSTVIDVVQHALEITGKKMKELGEKEDVDVPIFKKTIIQKMNPKAVTLGQLYGNFDIVSNEWHEGILAAIVRKSAVDMSGKRYFVIFDGPVDADWIENMNTCLDDNKKLCLSSGETIGLSPFMSIVFETQDLSEASPATVSRCGMVYMEPEDLGFMPIVHSWLTNIPDWLKENTDELDETAKPSFGAEMSSRGATPARASRKSARGSSRGATAEPVEKEPVKITRYSKENGTAVQRRLCHLCEWILDPIVTFVCDHLHTLVPVSESWLVSSFLKLMSSMFAKFAPLSEEEKTEYKKQRQIGGESGAQTWLNRRSKLLPPAFQSKEMLKMVDSIFMFSLIWSVCAVCSSNEEREIVSSLVRYLIASEAELKKPDKKREALKKHYTAVMKFAPKYEALGNFPEEDKQAGGRKSIRPPAGEVIIDYGEFVDVIMGADNNMKSMSLSFAFPHKDLVFDYNYNCKSKEWIYWGNDLSVPNNPSNFKIDEGEEYQDVLVPTIDTCRFGAVLKTLVSNGQNVLVTGETGTGKTVVIQELLLNGMDQDKYLYIPLNFSAQTSANRTQDILDSSLDRRRRGVYGPPLGKIAVVFVDDLNMPAREKYGAQPPIELLRQFVDHGGWYDRKSLHFMNIVDTQLVTAMGPPGGGRNPVTPRFLRHFNMITFPEMDNESLQHVFGTILTHWIDTKMTKAPGEVSTAFTQVVKSTVDVFNTIRRELLPTP